MTTNPWSILWHGRIARARVIQIDRYGWTIVVEGREEPQTVEGLDRRQAEDMLQILVAAEVVAPMVEDC